MYSTLILYQRLKLEVDALDELAYTVLGKRRQSSETFQRSAEGVMMLCTALRETEKYSRTPGVTVSDAQRTRLKMIFINCTKTLHSLDKMVTHYECLSINTRLSWDRLKWQEPELERIRLLVDQNHKALNAENASLAL